jgi:hypothetical protein
VLSNVSTDIEFFWYEVFEEYSPKSSHRERPNEVTVSVQQYPVTPMRRFSGTSRHSTHEGINPENLARLWNIGIETAKRTLQVTTQQGIRTALHPLHRRYRVDHLHLNRRLLNGDWFTDMLNLHAVPLGLKHITVI